MDGRKDGSVTISLRNFVGEGITRGINNLINNSSILTDACICRFAYIIIEICQGINLPVQNKCILLLFVVRTHKHTPNL